MKRYISILSLLCCLLLAACGSAAKPATPALPNANPTSGTTTPSSSTNAGGAPTSLHVTRTDLSATDSLGPLDVTVTDVQTVQKLYTAAEALPAYPSQDTISESCLTEQSVVYHLDFLKGSTEVQHINLDPGSCLVLYFSQTDLRQLNQAYLNLFKQAIQVNSLTN
jgi:hypothetical protein